MTASACAEAGKSLIAVLQVLLPAVDRDNARAAFGQQPDGRGADDAGSAGDDGDLAIQTNSIGHFAAFPLAGPVVPGFLVVFARRRANALIGGDYFICGGG